jgi:hypothetical protein
MTATWDFDTPVDYTLSDTTMANGEVNLTLDSYTWLQTTEVDFQAGNFTNTSTTLISDGEVVIDSSQNMTNLVKNETFAGGLEKNWVYNSTKYIYSQWNSTGENAELNFTVPVVPELKIVNFTPAASGDDGHVYYEYFAAPIGYGKDDTFPTANVGEIIIPFNVDRDWRSYFYFDISSITDLATILDVSFYVYVNLESTVNGHRADFHALDNDSSQSVQSLFFDTSDGRLYIDDTDIMRNGAGTGYKSENLGAFGIADVQANLTRDWFGIGIEEEGDDDIYAEVGTIDGPNPSYLSITYLDPGTSKTFKETAYVNQTFTKNKGTPAIPSAVNLNFNYTIDNFNNIDDTWLVVEIDGTPLWQSKVTGLIPLGTVDMDVGLFMTAAKDYTISFQLYANETSSSQMTCLAKFDNVNITVLEFTMDGTFTSVAYNAGGVVMWGDIAWDAVVPPETTFTIRTRSSPDGLAWSSWSGEYSIPLGYAITSPNDRYIQYTVNLSTINESQIPVLNEVTISYKSYRATGTIEMITDLNVPSLSNWGTFEWVEALNGETIEYWYSTDGGFGWTPVPGNGSLSGASISSKTIRFRAILSTTDPTVTPILYSWNLTYLVGDVSALTGSVSPGFGYVNQWFNFTVNYTDPEGDPPVDGNVYLNITSGTSHLGSWIMTEVDPSDSDYSDGKWYFYSYTGFARGTNYTFHFAAQDPSGLWGLSGTKDGPYILNSPPQITTSNDQEVVEGQLYYVDYEAADLEGDVLTWYVDTNCSWLTINSATGELQGTPLAGDTGWYWVNVSADDGYGGSDWTNFTLIVENEVSNLLGGVDPGFGYVNQWFNFTVNYTDLEGDAPVGGIVYLNITGGTSHLGSWDMIELDSGDTDYTDGKWYYYNYTGFMRGNNYTFHFAALDPSGIWSLSNTKDGPYVLNSPPRITTNNDQGAEEGQLYYVDYEAADLENDLPNWFFTTNCSWLTMDPGTGVLQGTPPPGDTGYYWVNVSVDDGNGGLDWTNFSLVVGDTIPPTADAGQDGSVIEDGMYQFNGTNSTDNSGVLNYTWYFGDGTSGFGPQPTHIYIRNGTYDVFLVVKDPLDNEDWAHIQITVENLQPVAVAGPDQTIFEGEIAYFDGSNSFDTLTDNASLVYIWDLDGDGNYGDRWGITTSFPYNNDGTVTAGLMVLDNDGEFAIDTMVVTVLNIAPAVDIGDFYKGEVGTDITLVAHGSDPGDDILEYRWDFEDDGQWDTGFSTDSVIVKKWSSVANYTVRCQVSDGNDFGEDTASVDVSRRKEPPTIDDLGTVKIRFSDLYTIDLSTFIKDEDTPLDDLTVRTTDPANISIDGLKIHLLYPAEARGEMVFVEVFVSDGDAEANSTLGIEITANFPPTLDSPIPDVLFLEDDESVNVFNLNDFFNDRDGESLTFNFNYTNPNLIVQEKSGWVTFISSPNWAGSTLIIIRAQDPNGAFKEDAILVTVTPVNDPPIVLKEIPKGFRTINENENWTIDLYDYFLDVDTPYITFECNNPDIIIDQLNHTATWVPRGKETLSNVVFSASDDKYTVSLEPIDLKVRTPEPFPWLLMILPFILGLMVFAVYRELRYRYSIEEVFLVDNAGVLLVHLSRGESKAIDAKLVSGMLTAVQEFVRDSFRPNHDVDDTKIAEGALGKLEYGDFKIVIERGQYTFLSAVISGYDNKRLRSRIRGVVEEFETKYSTVLADWDGDMARFDGAEKIVGTLLKTASDNSAVADEEQMQEEDMITDYGEDGMFEDDLPSGDFADMPSYYDEASDDEPPPPEDHEEPPPPPPPPPPN